MTRLTSSWWAVRQAGALTDGASGQVGRLVSEQVGGQTNGWWADWAIPTVRLTDGRGWASGKMVEYRMCETAGVRAGEWASM